jgi:hypothetical protein
MDPFRFPPPLPDAFLRAFSLTPERIALVPRVNDQIRQRTHYGLRKETVTGKNGWRISWYNGSADWNLGYRSYKKGQVVELDANEVLVQNVNGRDLRAILKWLEPLPLYAASSEAKVRGFFDPMKWLAALRQEWEDGR